MHILLRISSDEYDGDGAAGDQLFCDLYPVDSITQVYVYKEKVWLCSEEDIDIGKSCYGGNLYLVSPLFLRR